MAQWVMAPFEMHKFAELAPLKMSHSQFRVILLWRNGLWLILRGASSANLCIFLRILFLSWTAAEGHAWWWLPIPSSTIACGWRPISATAGWTYLFSVG